MDLFGLRKPALVCDTEEIYVLLLAILPTFAAIAELKHNDPSSLEDASTETEKFYLSFYALVFSLNAVLVQWDPTEPVLRTSTDEAEVKTNIMRVLDELENRFVSRSRKEAALAFRRLHFESTTAETYPKLRALRRTLPDDDILREDFLTDVNHIIRIHNKSGEKRRGLLRNLGQALGFFLDNLQPLITDTDSACPIRFSEYPLKHVRKLTKTLFDVVQKNWCCQCTSSVFHSRRQTRLNLTQYQRFEINPVRGKVLSNSETRFRILFPSASRNLEWQDTEISVNNRDHEKARHTEIKNGLCGIIQGAKAGIRPRMVVYAQRLWQLRAEVEMNQLSSPQVRDGEFMTLKDLLQPNQNRGSSISSIGGKDRLILSFVLATSLLHFFRGPWLQANLSSEDVCFLVLHQYSPLDITKPYLATSFSTTGPSALPTGELTEPHPFPDILSLGIVLLEIARGASIDFKEGQDRCFVSLKCMDTWARSCRVDSSRLVPEGLRQAISACIDPTFYKNMSLDKTSVNDIDVRKYIFERVLYPLEDALTTVYEVRLNTLYADIALDKEVKRNGSFDHRDDHQTEKQEAADEWFTYLDGVHAFSYECLTRCHNLGQAAASETRVKVAVLDTGLQLIEPLQQIYEDEQRINIQQSETFMPTTQGDTSHKWNVDCDGHGSRVGQIILQVAPAVDLHIAKVFKNGEDLANSEMATQVHGRIAEAIDRATTDWKVDMIVMSFGFDEPIPLIRKAMDKASKADKPPIFFAATRNDGAHKQMAWPAKDMSVIGVSSTAGNGDASTFNPIEKGAHPILYALGECVPVTVAHPDPNKPDKSITRYVSGTSYATPVAVAMAATLLGCVRMIVKTSSVEDQTIYDHVLGDLQRTSGMLAVLRRHMQKEHACGVESILPWDFLKVESLDNNRILEDIAEALRRQ